jgi:hypothetical protein
VRKAISILLVFVYAVSVSGMVIQKRFCGTRLIESGLAGTLKDCCMMEEMKSCKTNCCLEKAEVVKVESAQEKPEVSKDIQLHASNFSHTTFVTVNPGVSDRGSESSFNKMLPQKIPLRIFYSVFRL